MKKVMRFIKRRICPIMLALVIVFFSVVIPCAKVKAASVAVPVDGFTYFDLVHTLFYTTGFEASIMKEDGTRKTFTEEMYDELCDCFDIWCYQNFGTTDADEIKGQLRALPDQIVDGTVTVSKALWEAVQSWASDAYTYAVCPYSAPSFGYVHRSDGSVTNLAPRRFDSPVSLICLQSSGSFAIYALSSVAFKQYYTAGGSLCYHSPEFYEGYYFYRISYGNWPSSDMDFFGLSVIQTDLSIYSWLLGLSGVSYPTDNVADVLWPQQDLAIDKVGSTTWDDAIASDVVVPGEVADTGSIAIDDSIPADSDVIPGTVDVPEEKDDTKEEEKEKEEEEEEEGEKENTDETVTDEDIGTLPDKVAAVGDITKLFPFCIPFDLVALIKGMKAQEKAPVWHFKYYFKDINYTFEFTVDMTDYEKYIKIFRAGIMIFWIIALMFITIRYSSGIAKD